MTQQRWFCHGCQREWVHAHDWDEQSCPVCHALQIEHVTYQAAFPGGDIPRGVVLAPSLNPPRVLVAAEDRNWAVELSGGAT